MAQFSAPPNLVLDVTSVRLDIRKIDHLGPFRSFVGRVFSIRSSRPEYLISSPFRFAEVSLLLAKSAGQVVGEGLNPADAPQPGRAAVAQQLTALSI